MKKVSLATQIFIALVLGIAVGAFFHGNESIIAVLTPAGDIFIHLIKMIVIPIVVAAIVVAIAGVEDLKTVGRLGGKTILYFEIVTTIALAVGLLSANLFQPGTGIDMSSIEKSDISKYEATTEEVKENGGLAQTIVHIVPENIFEALSQGDLLPTIFFSVLLGLGVAAIGPKGTPVFSFFEGILEAMFWVTNQVMKLAPIGVFALISVTVVKFGLGALIPLGKLVLVTYGTMFFFIFAVLGIIAKWAGTSIFILFTVLKDELILAFSTASSESVLPRLIEKMEKFGCPKSITSFVIPTGYTFNLDGSALYQSIAALFVAQMYGIHLSIAEQITLLLTLMITSKGIAGVPGASIVVLLATLGAMGLPLEGLAFIVGIDRLLDMCRTSVNVFGNALAAIVLSKWEGQFDNKLSKQYVASIKKEKAA